MYLIGLHTTLPQRKKTSCHQFILLALTFILALRERVSRFISRESSKLTQRLKKFCRVVTILSYRFCKMLVSLADQGLSTYPRMGFASIMALYGCGGKTQAARLLAAAISQYPMRTMRRPMTIIGCLSFTNRIMSIVLSFILMLYPTESRKPLSGIGACPFKKSETLTTSIPGLPMVIMYRYLKIMTLCLSDLKRAMLLLYLHTMRMWLLAALDFSVVLIWVSSI